MYGSRVELQGSRSFEASPSVKRTHPPMHTPNRNVAAGKTPSSQMILHNASFENESGSSSLSLALATYFVAIAGLDDPKQLFLHEHNVPAWL